MAKKKKGADGLYHVQKFICRREDGSRYYARFDSKNLDEAIMAANAFKAEYLAGLHREEDKKAPPVKKCVTLLNAMDKYIDTCRTLTSSGEYSPSTIAGYVSVRSSIEKKPCFAEIANCPIMDLTVDAIQSAMDRAAQPDEHGVTLSPKTIRNIYGLIKPTVEKYGPDIRLDKIRIARRRTKRTMMLCDSAMPDVLRAARSIGDDFFLYIMFTAVLGTRPSESFALRWGDVSASPMISISGGQKLPFGTISIDKACVRDELGRYQIKGTKTESGMRTLSRHWSFFETLYSIRPRGRDDERILRMNPSQLPYRWKKLKEDVNLPDGMVMYDLRHYHGSVMAACGAPARYIADDMGHSDISITNKFYIEEIAEKRQEINTAMFEHTADLLKNANISK